MGNLKWSKLTRLSVDDGRFDLGQIGHHVLALLLDLDRLLGQLLLNLLRLDLLLLGLLLILEHLLQLGVRRLVLGLQLLGLDREGFLHLFNLK